MMADDWNTGLDELLEALPTHDGSARGAERTRDACLAALAGVRARAARPAAARRMTWAEPLIVTAASIAYLAAAVHASLALLRL
jgi:hypothetical protein